MPPPNVFTIAPDRPFLETLARGLVALAEDDPLLLPRMTVLLPTRRAARSLRETFLRLTAEDAEAAPLLLPRLRPIGDLDDDDIGVWRRGRGDAGDPAGDPGVAAAAAADPARARLERGQGRQRRCCPARPPRWPPRSPDCSIWPQSEEANFDKLRELAPEEYAEHWQLVVDFLEMLPTLWPAILEAEGAIDPADRRNRLLRRQARLWRETPPRAPGYRGRIDGRHAGAVRPAVRGRLARPGRRDPARARPHRRPRGMGADRERAEPSAAPAGAAAAGPGTRAGRGARLAAATRPGYEAPFRPLPARRQATGGVGRATADAEAQPAAAAGGAGAAPCQLDRFLARSAAEGADALAGLSRYDCASPQDEGATIALLLRRALETPGMTAALVTPDRELARRVAAELRRWDIEIDDSAGVPLARTPPGVFLRLVLDLAASALAPVPLLAALKHPLAAGGLAPEAFRERARRLESAIRGPRPAPGFAGTQGGAGRQGSEPSAALCRSPRGLPRPPRRPDRSRSGAARRAGLGACRRGRASRRDRQGDRDRAVVARRGRRGGGPVLSRADRCRRRFPGAAGTALPGAVRRARFRHGRAPALTAAIRAWRSGVSWRRGCSRPICSCSAGSTRALGPDRRPMTPGCRGRCAGNSGSRCPSARSASPRMISRRGSARPLSR